MLDRPALTLLTETFALSTSTWTMSSGLLSATLDRLTLPNCTAPHTAQFQAWSMSWIAMTARAIQATFGPHAWPDHAPLGGATANRLLPFPSLPGSSVLISVLNTAFPEVEDNADEAHDPAGWVG